jgi:predicted nucleic acid-binding protein
MPRILLDSGPVIRYLRGRQRTVQLLRTLSRSERLTISVITRAEINAGLNLKDRFVTQRTLGRFITLDVDREIADRAGEIMNTLRRRGVTLEVPDALIGATALLHQLTLLTYNRSDFEQIPGLSLYPLSDNGQSAY